MSNPKFNHLSLVDALCISRSGWFTENEKELFAHAFDVIELHARKLKLRHDMLRLEEKTAQLEIDSKQ
jgi:hypothetical protein